MPTLNKDWIRQMEIEIKVQHSGTTKIRKLKIGTPENWKLDSEFQNQEILKGLELENWNGNPKFTRKYQIRMF